MKIVLFFHPSSDLYGSDKILISIIKNYNTYEKILVLQKTGPLVEVLQKECPDLIIHFEPDIPLFVKKHMTLKGVIRFIYFLIKFNFISKKLQYKFKPNIVYLNTLATSPIVLFFSKKTTKVIHVHEILKNSNIFHRIINSIAINYCNYAICVSKAVLNNMVIARPQLKHKLKLIYNGVNFNTSNHENASQNLNTYNIKKNKINFALIGRIKPSHKGQYLLLDAISLIQKEILNNAHFYIIGSTVDGQEYMLNDVVNKIKSYDLEDCTTILPFVEKIELVYKMIDVILVPSIVDDSFPTTVLEGMFFSKPIIGTKVGGIPEMIVNDKTGFITNPNDPFDLSEKIKYFILNREKIREMGELSKLYFDNNFSEEIFVRNYNLFLKNEVNLNT